MGCVHGCPSAPTPERPPLPPSQQPEPAAAAVAEKAEQQGTAQKKAELPQEAASVEGEKSSRRERRAQSSRSAAEAARPGGSFANRARGEQVVAGWPVWLSALPLPLFFPVALPLRTNPDPSAAPPRPSPSLPLHNPAAQSLALIQASCRPLSALTSYAFPPPASAPRRLLFTSCLAPPNASTASPSSSHCPPTQSPTPQNLVSSGSLIRWIKGFSIEDTVLAIPAITMSAGLLFGSVTGTIIVSIRGTLAATVAFLIARYFAKERILKLGEGNKKFLAIDKAIGENGFKVVTLLRLSPLLPFSLGNYLYGFTSVKFLAYVLGSWLGMLPGSWAYVSAGAFGRAIILVVNVNLDVSMETTQAIGNLVKERDSIALLAARKHSLLVLFLRVASKLFGPVETEQQRRRLLRDLSSLLENGAGAATQYCYDDVEKLKTNISPLLDVSKQQTKLGQPLDVSKQETKLG
ncbi:hypothetical protein GUJ93_ZPchr0007g4799 [Zizania palustris]|uniref:VTT domain-containing protein n=1 Tax=Zizania palustris TaxID=103762 RepID=A0A8J5TEH6_ZIZPA|nr:hypothetical protein GUJ93_ZPchr0007g4799 [Zizania palustris]